MASSPNGDDTSSAGSWSPEIKSRWRFTSGQNDILEEAYQGNPNPSSGILESLVTELRSPRKTIITWFQNRRAKERRHQRQRRQRQSVQGQPFVPSSDLTTAHGQAAIVSSQREAFPVLDSEDFSILPHQGPLAAATTATVQRQQINQAEMMPPLGILLPSSLHEMSWHQHRSDAHLNDNRAIHTSSIPTEEWISFSALWQYVYNQSHYLSDENEVHRNF